MTHHSQTLRLTSSNATTALLIPSATIPSAKNSGQKGEASYEVARKKTAILAQAKKEVADRTAVSSTE
jgi:hypothetical protein